MEPLFLRLNLNFLLLAFFVSSPCHSLPPFKPRPGSPERAGIPPHYLNPPQNPFHSPPMGQPKVTAQPDDLLRDPPGKSIPKDQIHCRSGSRNCTLGNRPLLKKRKFNVGKKLGFVFAGVGVGLQVLLGGFLIYKRWQLREVGDGQERIPPRSTLPSTA